MKSEKLKLPEGWKWVKLGEVVDLEVGIRPKGGATEEGIPSLGGEHITENGRIVFSDENAKFIPEDFYKAMTKGKVKELDILINKDGANTGKVGILKNLFTKRVAINEHVFILRAKGNLEQRFLFYWLFSHLGQTKIKEIITGSAQPGLSASFVNFLSLPTPPLPEQQKIAEILETVDNAIEKTERIIEKYKRIKQGLMQELLTKGIDENWQIRSEKTHKFKDSPLGRIPEEWEVVRLWEVGTIVGGFGFPIKYQGNEYGEIPFIKVDDLNKTSKYINSASNYIGKETLNTLKAKAFGLNTIIFPKIGIAAYHNKYRILKVIATFDNNIAGVIIKNAYCEFIYYYFTGNIDLKKIAGETAVPSVQKTTLENIKIPLPPLPEQQRIAKILSQIDEVIEKEENYKRKLESLKRGLMEDLLTGKVRVNKLLEEGYEDKECKS